MERKNKFAIIGITIFLEIVLTASLVAYFVLRSTKGMIVAKSIQIWFQDRFSKLFFTQCVTGFGLVLSTDEVSTCM